MSAGIAGGASSPRAAARHLAPLEDMDFIEAENELVANGVNREGRREIRPFSVEGEIKPNLCDGTVRRSFLTPANLVPGVGARFGIGQWGDSEWSCGMRLGKPIPSMTLRISAGDQS